MDRAGVLREPGQGPRQPHGSRWTPVVLRGSPVATAAAQAPQPPYKGMSRARGTEVSLGHWPRSRGWCRPWLQRPLGGGAQMTETVPQFPSLYFPLSSPRHSH